MYIYIQVENDLLTIEAELEIDIEYTIYLKNGEDVEHATKELIKVVEKIENYTYKDDMVQFSVDDIVQFRVVN